MHVSERLGNLPIRIGYGASHPWPAYEFSGKKMGSLKLCTDSAETKVFLEASANSLIHSHIPTSGTPHLRMYSILQLVGIFHTDSFI